MLRGLISSFLFLGAATLVGCGSAPAPNEEVGEAVSAVNGNGAGQNRDIDIEVIDTPDLSCGGWACFFIGADKNITHVWVDVAGCEPSDYWVEIDGHPAGPSDAGPPDCDGFGGVRYVTGGRNPTDEYFDSHVVCVGVADDVAPGTISVQAKVSATCEQASVGCGVCEACGCWE